MKRLSARRSGPRAIDLGICLLPGRAVAQPHDGVKIRCLALALAARLKRRIQIGIQAEWWRSRAARR